MPMINGRFHMNPMFGAGIERARERERGGSRSIHHVEVHPSADGKGFEVHSVRVSVGRSPHAPDIASDENPEVKHFPGHDEMMEFVRRLTQELHGGKAHGDDSLQADNGGDNSESERGGIRVPGSEV